jgi:hypothetical protein
MRGRFASGLPGAATCGHIRSAAARPEPRDQRQKRMSRSLGVAGTARRGRHDRRAIDRSGHALRTLRRHRPHRPEDQDPGAGHLPNRRRQDRPVLGRSLPGGSRGPDGLRSRHALIQRSWVGRRPTSRRWALSARADLHDSGRSGSCGRRTACCPPLSNPAPCVRHRDDRRPCADREAGR